MASDHSSVRKTDVIITSGCVWQNGTGQFKIYTMGRGGRVRVELLKRIV